MKKSFGPIIGESGVTFRLFAPAARQVSVVLNKALPMQREGDWFVLQTTDAGPGTLYRFLIDGELSIPDPASRFQPEDVHGPSEIIAQDYAWSSQDWKGRAWAEAVFSELHVGTFTPGGTYLSAIERLDHLVETGITAIELMPLSDFSGRWNWGYDGVLPFAPDSVYGRPNDLKAFIDAAHSRGLMVFLDVVYNHFGPEGNYLPRIAPQFFNEHETPWGGAIDYTRDATRAFVIENVLYWLRDFRFDGLRLDAVHAIVAPGSPNLLYDLSKAVGVIASQTQRLIHLVLENDDNRADFLAPSEEPPNGRFRAQWNDDYHHAWHRLLTGEDHSYYKDYDDPISRIAVGLTQGFIYQGSLSRHRNGKKRGEPSEYLPATAFVNFLQNHDQIGNRARGERLTVLSEPRRLVAALTVLLLSPAPPLLFMGEEWGAIEPFPFFCDFKGTLAEAVRQGRRAEFADDYARTEDIPDPVEPSTRLRACLDWSRLQEPASAKRLNLVRELIRTRMIHIAPLSDTINGQNANWFRYGDVLDVTWTGKAKTLRLLANLSDEPAKRPDQLRWGRPIWGGEPAVTLAPWSAHVAIQEE